MAIGRSLHEAALAIADGDAGAIEEMDALDDIGPAVVEAIGRFFGEPITTSPWSKNW
jgi:DNA ligase (NAD+)